MSVEKVADWSLPFQPCRVKIADIANTSYIASDNGDILLILSSTGSLISLDPLTNTFLWNIDLGSEFISNYESSNKSLFVVSKIALNSEIVTLRAISKITGITIWQVDLPFSDVLTLKRIKDHLLVFYDQDVAGFNVESGSKKWSIKAKHAKLSIGDEFLDELNQERYLYFRGIAFGLFEDDGVKYESITALFATNESVTVGETNGKLSFYDISKLKKVWSFKAGGKITSITRTADDTVLVSSLDNFLYLLTLKDGNLRWKRRLPFRITDRPLVIDHIAVVGNKGNDKIFFVDLDSGKILNQISLPESEYLTANLLFIRTKIIVPTTHGVFTYSQDQCKN